MAKLRQLGHMSIGSVFQIGNGRKYYQVIREIQQKFYINGSYQYRIMIEYKQIYSNNQELYYKFPDFIVKVV